MTQPLVEVYWNLTRQCWSVRQGGRVVGHMPTLLLQDVTMIVRPGGRDRVRRTGHKEVHAGVRGTLAQHPPPAGLERDRHNPMTCDTFVLDDGRPVHQPRIAVFTEDGRLLIVASDASVHTCGMQPPTCRPG